MKKAIRIIHWLRTNGLINTIHRIRHINTFDVNASESFKVGNSSITDSSALASYPTVCGLASENEDIFKIFRRSKVLIEAFDHVSLEQGFRYLTEILKQTKWIEDFSRVINKVDSLGEPLKYKYSKFGTFSPTLLRYLKVYLDLEKLFGDLSEFRIVEIGVGFGGQASLLSLLASPLEYTFYDIPPVLSLAQKFVSELKLQSKFDFRDGRNPSIITADLVISNYAFSELSRNLQTLYLENVILKCPRGYITWNPLSSDYLGGFTLAELIRLIPNSQIYPERPNTFEGNALIVWGI